jgi:hypothetical protein
VTTMIHILIQEFAYSRCASISDEIIYWIANFVGLMLEDYTIKDVYYLVHRTSEAKTKRIVIRGLEISGPWIGRLWLFSFLFWIVGKVEYNKYGCWADMIFKIRKAKKYYKTGSSSFKKLLDRY